MQVGDRVDWHERGRVDSGRVVRVACPYSAARGEEVTTVTVEWERVAHGEERYTRHALGEFVLTDPRRRAPCGRAGLDRSGRPLATG